MSQSSPPATDRPRPEPLGIGFRRLLAALGLGNLGDGIAVVALPWYAATITDDPFMVALVGAATRLPWLLFALPAGVLGDRVDRRRLMMAAGGIKASLLAALAALAFMGLGSIPSLIVFALLVGVCEVFFDNTAQSMLPTVVPRSRLERANGLFQGVERVLNKFVGAPLAGVLLAVSTGLAFGVQALLILGAVAMLFVLRGNFRAGDQETSEEPRPASSTWSRLREGVVWMWRHPVMRPMALITGLSNLGAALMASVMVLFVQDVLGAGPQAYGLLMTVAAVGAVAGSVVIPSFATRMSVSTSLVLSLTLMAVAALTLALLRSVPAFMVCQLLIGFASMWWNITAISLFGRVIPDRLRSRVFSAHRTLSWGMLPLGMLLGGALARFSEGLLGREWSLALPFLSAGLLETALVGITALVLTRRVVDEALARSAPGAG
ncbi:MFS transporter [Nocardiopsis alba]|uniref:MFS transporter n=1 Tax=Nocardiopsis alba TaxID=53437 RepID=UPI0033DB7A47